MIPYTPYALSISLTPYVLLLEVVLAACVAYLLVALTADRKRMREALVFLPAGRGLRRRLWHSRMRKMLRRLHVDPVVYLCRVPAGEVRMQLDTCSSCAHQFLCDQALASDPSADVDLSFCPNRLAVIPLARAA